MSPSPRRVRSPRSRWRLVLVVLGGHVAALALGASIARGPRSRAQAPATRTLAGALPSAFVYPPQRIALQMNHAHPGHRDLACTRCHVDASRSRAASDRLVPAEETCLPCHAEAIDRSTEPAGCALCHVGGELAPGEVALSELPTPRLRFSHAAHLRGEDDDVESNGTCEACHRGVREVALATRAQLPTMELCWQCHGGDGIGRRASGASHACTSCHPAAADGTLPQEIEGQLFLPPAWMHGVDHDRDFMVRHRWLAADHATLCAECHRDRECEDCHDGRVRPSARLPTIQRRTLHPGDFLQTHAVAARRNQPECTSCHTVQRFCTECHARLGLAEVSAPSAAVSSRFHPAGFEGSAHAVEARRSMSACASCHTEQDCVRCHGAVGIGAGISPHPPGFATQCSTALGRNPRACQLCHGEGYRCP